MRRPLWFEDALLQTLIRTERWLLVNSRFIRPYITCNEIVSPTRTPAANMLSSHPFSEIDTRTGVFPLYFFSPPVRDYLSSCFRRWLAAYARRYSVHIPNQSMCALTVFDMYARIENEDGKEEAHTHTKIYKKNILWRARKRFVCTTAAAASMRFNGVWCLCMHTLLIASFLIGLSTYLYMLFFAAAAERVDLYDIAGDSHRQDGCCCALRLLSFDDLNAAGWGRGGWRL